MRAILFLLLCALSCQAAPAPAPRRREAPPAPPAACVMRWCGEWRAEFLPGGAYHAWRGECHYAGRWHMEGRTLVITESKTSAAPSSWQTYRAGMCPRVRAGRFEGGGELRLEAGE